MQDLHVACKFCKYAMQCEKLMKTYGSTVPQKADLEKVIWYIR